jgi:hypothetical protein
MRGPLWSHRYHLPGNRLVTLAFGLFHCQAMNSSAVMPVFTVALVMAPTQGGRRSS